MAVLSRTHAVRDTSPALYHLLRVDMAGFRAHVLFATPPLRAALSNEVGAAAFSPTYPICNASSALCHLKRVGTTIFHTCTLLATPPHHLLAIDVSSIFLID